MHEGHRARLRELYFENGLDALNDHQILELLLSFSIPRKDTNELAHSLLDRYGSLPQVFSAEKQDLSDVSGIGENSAALVKLIGDVTRRISMSRYENARLKTSLDAARFCISLMSLHKYEAMYVISLDKSKKVLHSDKISSGTLNETVVYPRLVVECALRHHAYRVLLTHNHPSGNIMPSSDDIHTTARIAEALEMIGISLEEHIITGRDCAYCILGRSELTQTVLFQSDMLAAKAP